MKLRSKLLVFFVPLYLVAVVVMTVLARSGVQRIVIDGVLKRGLSVATAVHSEAVEGFRLKREALLLHYLQAIQENAQAVYAMALSPDGRVLAHTNVVEVGRTYRDSITVSALAASETTSQEVLYNGNPTMDIAHPIWVLPEASTEAFLLLGDEGGHKQRLGTLRMGLPLQEALTTAARISNQVFWIITLGSALVLVLGFVFLQRLLHPIHLLSEAAQRVGRGQLKEVVPVTGSDEIGELTGHFNQMSQDLAETTVSKAYTDNILRSMNDALIVVTPNGQIETVNAAACTLLGYAESELIGRPFEDILVRDQQAGSGGEATVGLVWGQPVRNVEQIYCARDGRHIPVLLSGAVLHSASGHITGTVYAARDITERKEAEAALRESEARFRRLSASAVEGVVLLDRGRILDANQAMARILGYERPEALIGQNGWQFVPKQARVVAIEKIRNNWSDYFEITIQKRDGTQLPAEVIGSRLPQQGRTIGVVAVRDLQQQKEAEESQRQLERSLIQAERMASVGTAAAGIVHNLKSPLTGVLGFADILQKKFPDMKEVEMIASSANMMAEMVENILDKSRQNKTFDAIDMNVLLQRELDFLKADRIFKDLVTVKTHFSNSLPKIWCAYTDMSQVFGNLLRNASEAMHQSVEKKLEISTLQKERHIQVVIQDTGAGISQKNLDNLFEPFFTTKTGDGMLSPQGTGLGLYIVKQILEEYGGKIEAQSEEGMGTTFYVTIPIQRHMY